MIKNGIYAAALTPMNDDLSINFPLFANHCHHLLSNGCDGLVIFGSTGEANSFSVEERKKALEAIVNEGIPASKLIVGSGCASLTDSVELSCHAMNLGVSRLLILPPFYYKNINDKGLFGWFEELIRRVDIKHLQILLYHIPQISGTGFSFEIIKKLIKTFPNEIAGVKDSSGDWEHMKELCRRFPDLKIFSGNEKFLLDILNVGGAGTISATLNVSSKLAGELYSTWNTPVAKGLQEKLTRRRKEIEQFTMIPALKHLMSESTGNPDWCTVRPPLVALTTEDGNALIDNWEKGLST